MKSQLLLGLIRHLLTFGGGALVAQGDVSNPEVEELAGALCALIGVVWSIWEKRQSRRANSGTGSQDTSPPPPAAGAVVGLILCAAFLLLGTGCKSQLGDPAKRCEYYSAAYLAYQATAEVRADDLSKEEIMAARAAAIFLRAYCGWTTPATRGGPDGAEPTDANGVLILNP